MVYLVIVVIGVYLMGHATSWAVWNVFANFCFSFFIVFAVGAFGSDLVQAYLPASVLVKTPAKNVDLKLVSVRYSWLSWEQGGYDYINYSQMAMASLKKEETDKKGES